MVRHLTCMLMINTIGCGRPSAAGQNILVAMNGGLFSMSINIQLQQAVFHWVLCPSKILQCLDVYLFKPLQQLMVLFNLQHALKAQNSKFFIFFDSAQLGIRIYLILVTYVIIRIFLFCQPQFCFYLRMLCVPQHKWQSLALFTVCAS